MIYDPGAGLTLIVFDGTTWAYDSAAKRWTHRDSVAPEGPLLRLAYDAQADTWHPLKRATLAQVPETAANRMLTYDGTVDRLLAYDGPSVELFDEESGTWPSTEARSPVVIHGGYFSWAGEITYDDAVGRTVIVGLDAVIAYDAAGDEWETLSLSPDSPASGMHHQAISDPLNERIVVMGGKFYDPEIPRVSWVRRDDVWALEAWTRECSELVSSLEAEPA